ncbi:MULTISPECIES: MarR family winged helix-turn-helix transcriptional regulator [Micrococcaceae]|uniref:Transcriptional regulator, MarR family n=2 Tax=Pseudarthrobacter TaxID=1742993 RepID=B8HAT3_PSECP|nr:MULTISPECIES: MarR family transcriptional regulator [Pseudarthrobacter]KQQ80442.1 MarR family transcriptional regulator [Arthrobacter sp. Leaf137]ACL40247.1 transcriptional regulator, MarR family [Pseudarthrobacter chlorophenolicus A6]MCT9625059.1 MarR family transcriptional regulator [Pseudarthrobacter equi]SDQ85033.1 DNA-binding transcriptional regulator, MarR family [Pseudarthrobacter chlorophenolicus]SDT38571.1 DNA-binding transcriptional regulator, MarR family [Pseudarthrobacter equi]
MDHWPTGRLLSTAARLVEHSWNEKLGAIGLTHAGVIAIEVLAAQGPMTQAQLAQYVRVQAQTMGKTLSRLETHGHIARVRSTSDRRSHVVSLTERGKEAVAEAVEMERSVLASSSIDPELLRQELKSVVRELASQFATTPGNAAALVDNPSS